MIVLRAVKWYTSCKNFEQTLFKQIVTGDFELYAKLKDIVNLALNLGETIPKLKIVRKVLRSLLERFHAKITAIENQKILTRFL